MLRSLSIFVLLAFMGCIVPVGMRCEAADPKPLRALLITGGCCHDYAAQKDILKKGIEERAHIIVEQIHSDNTTTAPPLRFSETRTMPKASTS